MLAARSAGEMISHSSSAVDFGRLSASERGKARTANSTDRTSGWTFSLPVRMHFSSTHQQAAVGQREGLFLVRFPVVTKFSMTIYGIAILAGGGPHTSVFRISRSQ